VKQGNPLDNVAAGILFKYSPQQSGPQIFADKLSRSPVGLDREGNVVRNPPPKKCSREDKFEHGQLPAEGTNKLIETPVSRSFARQTSGEGSEKPPTSEAKYMIRNNIPYLKNIRTHPYGRAILP
jgi:hypothetical protein